MRARCRGNRERACRSLVGTVGRIEAKPGAINVIPGEVLFTVDVRAPDDALREQAVAAIRVGTQIGDRSGTRLRSESNCLQDFGVERLRALAHGPARARGRGARRARAAAAVRRRPRRHGDQGDRGHRHAVRALQGRREPQSGANRSPRRMRRSAPPCCSTLFMSSDPYPRDLIGYGGKPPKAKWPGSARVALQFVLNYEEGGENSILHGDPASEAFLSEIVGARPLEGVRHMSMESIYEYGSRVGVWRVLELFSRTRCRSPYTASRWRWSATPPRSTRCSRPATRSRATAGAGSTTRMSPNRSSASTCSARSRSIRELTGERPLGWYTGRTSPNTRKLVVEDGGFVYDADDYSDDLPWYGTRRDGGKPQLVVPYTLDANDMRFATPRDSTPATSSSPTSRTPSTSSTRKATAAAHDVGRPALPAGRPARAARLARALSQARARQEGLDHAGASTSRATG